MRKPAAEKRRVTVVGAGFSGLAAAFYLSRAGFLVDVIEQSDRAGGMISTQQAPFGPVETAANGILNSARVEELFRALGLELIGTGKTARRRFIFRENLRRWPLGLSGTLRVLYFLFRYFASPKSVAPMAGESVRDWATRTIGGEGSQFLVEAALQGVYAGDPSRLSAALIFGRFFSAQARSDPPRVKGTVSAREGMGQLMDRWRERLQGQGVQFIWCHRFPPFASVQPKHPHVIATSVHAAAEILRELDPTRSKACATVETLPLVTVTAGFREPPPPHLRGFGCLFPPVIGRPVLGVLMNSFLFPHRPGKGTNETWLFGGARAREIDSTLDRELVEMAAGERQAIFGVSGDYSSYRVTRWPKALPHYDFTLEQMLPEMTGLRRNAILIGNYLGEIGLSRILDRAARLPAEIAANGEWAR